MSKIDTSLQKSDYLSSQGEEKKISEIRRPDGLNDTNRSNVSFARPASSFGSFEASAEVAVNNLIDKITHPVAADEKKRLLAQLAAYYNVGVKSQRNERIRSALLNLIVEADRDVAGPAARQYARLGYFDDTEQLLLFAVNKGAIDHDIYIDQS